MKKGGRKGGYPATKFMQVLDPRIFNILKKRSNKAGVSVQELIRVRVIPDWLKANPDERRRARRQK